MTNHHDLKEISCAQTVPDISKICMETALTYFYFGSILRLATSGLAGDEGLRRIFMFPCQPFSFLSLLLFLSCPHLRMPQCKTHDR